jgi:hypothetical protein
MKRNTTLVAGLLLVSLWLSTVWAQDSAGQSGARRASLGFSQDLNLYQWFMIAQYPLHLQNGLRIVFSEQFISSLQRMALGDKWKDDQNFSMAVRFPFSSRVTLRANLFSSLYRDQFSSLDNDKTLTAGRLGASFYPGSGIEISSSVGNSWEHRLGRTDRGLTFGLDIRADDVRLEGYHNRFQLGAVVDRYRERQNEDLNLTYRVHRQFYTDTADTLLVTVKRLRRDSYVADPLGIYVESLQRTMRQLRNLLRYRLSSAAVLRWTSTLSLSDVDIKRIVDGSTASQRGHDTFETENLGQLLLRGKRGFATFSIQFRSLSKRYNIPDSVRTSPFSRRFASVAYDIDGSTFSLSQQLGLRLGRRDSLGVFVSATRFRHDNSDSTNRDTHDEVRYHTSVALEHRFGQRLRLHWLASVYLDHFVYLDRRFSGSNKWTRIFRLMPTLYYQPSRSFGWKQSFEVRAQYVVFDFDELFATRNSYVVREFIVSDSLGLRLSEKTSANLEYRFEIEELGGFVWDRWLEQPRSAWQNHSLRFSLSYRPAPGFLIAPGLTFFRQERWRYLNRPGEPLAKRSQGVHRNIGPTLRFVYRPRPSLELVLEGNSRQVDSFEGNRFYISQYNLSLNWHR